MVFCFEGLGILADTRRGRVEGAGRSGAAGLWAGGDEFAGVEDVVGVEGVFDALMEVAELGAGGEFPPGHFGEADAVFAGDDAAPGEDLTEEVVEGGIAAGRGTRPRGVHHDVDMDVAVTGVAETGDGEAVLLLEAGSEAEEVFEAATRNDDVFVEFGEAGVAEGIGEFAAELPDGFALGIAQAALNEEGAVFANDFGQSAEFAADGVLLAVELDDEVGIATGEALAAGAFARGSEGEGIRNFERAGKKAGAKNGAKGPDGVFHRAETDGETGTIRGQGKKLERGFGDDAEHSFRTDEQAGEVEAGFIFVSAAAESHHRAIGQDDFQTENVVAGNTVFQATRAAGIGGDVATKSAIGTAGGIGRIEEATCLDGGLKLLRDDARLHDGDEIIGIDFLNLLHPSQGQDDAAMRRNTAADITETCAAGGNGDAMALSKFEECGNRLSTARQNYGVRLVGSEPFIAGMLLANLWVKSNFAAGQKLH
ncbi:MAG: hypothetical protein JWR19_1279 [Pedosphaera sp.]|nr:hypothetical protein [Pedosphaera sp.]